MTPDQEMLVWAWVCILFAGGLTLLKGRTEIGYGCMTLAAILVASAFILMCHWLFAD